MSEQLLKTSRHKRKRRGSKNGASTAEKTMPVVTYGNEPMTNCEPQEITGHWPKTLFTIFLCTIATSLILMQTQLVSPSTSACILSYLGIETRQYDTEFLLLEDDEMETDGDFSSWQDKPKPWSQEVCSKHRVGNCVATVEKRAKLSLQEFQEIFDGKWPVIVTDIMSSWPAMEWSAEFFTENYGNSRVSMATYSHSERAGYSVPIEIFLKHLHESKESVWTYLQDELFLLQHPELRNDILSTVYTQEDFFQLLPPEVRPWDCMLLWGTAHSRSYLHIDPYNWTGTNAVISGLKKWKLLPPGQDHVLSIKPGRACGFPLECFKYNSDLDLFDPVHLGSVPGLRYLEVDQGPGEMLFIPTGWFHQAYNAVPTLAVSGQMMNSNNYKLVLQEFFKGGSVPKSALPAQHETMTPSEVVAAVASQIPKHVVKEGQRRTREALDQLKPPVK